MIVELSCAAIFAEMYFFIMHQFAHVPSMKHFHKLHHEFSHTCYALVGLYCSWQELVFINFPLGLLFPILTQMHTTNTCMFVIIAALNVLSQHSFHQIFPVWFDNAAYHMKHHQLAHENYAAPWTYNVAYCCCCCFKPVYKGALKRNINDDDDDNNYEANITTSYKRKKSKYAD
jgi:hypothetical protein